MKRSWSASFSSTASTDQACKAFHSPQTPPSSSSNLVSGTSQTHSHAPCTCASCSYSVPYISCTVHACIAGKAYDDKEAAQALAKETEELEMKSGLRGNRMFYFAIPPSLLRPHRNHGLHCCTDSCTDSCTDYCPDCGTDRCPDYCP